MLHRKTLFFLLIIILAVGFYVQDRCAIPNIDDWAYAFVVDEHSEGYLSVIDDNNSRQPVESFADAVVSQSRDYFKSNGRFIIHTLVQYFCGCWSMQQFAVANTVVFVFFALLLFRQIGRRLDLWQLFIVISSFWLLTPYLGFTFLGPISLCVNYLWTCTATFIFLLLFNHVRRSSPGRLSLSVFSIYALVVGSLQESFSIGIAGGLFFYLLFNRKRTSKGELVMSLAYMAGAMACLLSPANFARTDSIGGFGLRLTAITGLLSSPLFLLFLALNMVLIAKKRLIAFVKNNLILYTSIIIDTLFALLIAYTARQQLTAINIFILILLLRVFFDSVSQPRIQKAISLTMGAVSMVLFVSVYQIRKAYADSYHVFTERAVNSVDGIVCAKEFEAITSQYVYHRLYNNYMTCYSFVGWNLSKTLLSLYLTDGRDASLIKTVLPDTRKQIATACSAENEVRPHLYRIPDGYLVYKDSDSLSLANVSIKGEVRSGFYSNTSAGTSIGACEVFHHDDSYYYLFHNLMEIVAIDSLIVRK